MSERETSAARRPTRLHALLLYLIAAAGLAACSLLLPANTGMAAANLIYYLLFLAVPVALTIRKTGIEAFRPNPVSLRCMLVIVILALNGVLLADNLTVLWAIPFQKLGLDVNAAGVAIPSNPRELVVSILIMAVLPGICEEFLFRGAILSGLEAAGTKRAMLVSAALFALLHGSLIGLPSQFLLGLIITYIVVCSGSVYAGAIYHTVHNAATLILQYVQQRSASPDTAEVADYFTAIGGASGMFILLIEMLMSAAIIFLFLRMFRMRAVLHKIQGFPEKRIPLRRSEWAALLGALICVAGLYFADILLMLGGRL